MDALGECAAAARNHAAGRREHGSNDDRQLRRPRQPGPGHQPERSQLPQSGSLPDAGQDARAPTSCRRSTSTWPPRSRVRRASCSPPTASTRTVPTCLAGTRTPRRSPHGNGHDQPPQPGRHVRRPHQPVRPALRPGVPVRTAASDGQSGHLQRVQREPGDAGEQRPTRSGGRRSGSWTHGCSRSAGSWTSRGGCAA